MLTRLGERTVLDALFAAAGASLLVTDAAGRILFCGESCAQALGHPREMLLGQSLRLCPAEADNIISPAVPPRAHGAPLADPLQWTPLSNAAGECLGYLGRLPTESNCCADMRARTLQEANHQVRNHLAIMCALLEMELIQAPEAERRRLLVSLARTRSLSLAHNLMVDATGCVDVGMLLRAVVDSVRALFPGVEGRSDVIVETPSTLSARRATYLGLALTELTVQMLQCAISRGCTTFPTIRLAREGDNLHLTVEHPASTVTFPCLEAGSLSREILYGMVERSLAGTCSFAYTPTFRAIIRCPLDEQ